MRFQPTDSVRLVDGRRLMFVASGPDDGYPVVYCHGAIGTPLAGSVDVEVIAGAIGIRHIAVSRPGIGGSDRACGRSVVEFAADVHQLLDAIGIGRFDVVGVSAGGPYALALAHQLPDRVRRVAVCSSLSQLCAPSRTPGMKRRIRVALAFLGRAPGLCATVGDVGLPVVRRHPELLMRVIAAHAADSERGQLQKREERSAASVSFLDAATHGVRGMIDDYLAGSRPWGFATTEIGAEVDLWHGMEDPLVPIEHALQLAVPARVTTSFAAGWPRSWRRSCGQRTRNRASRGCGVRGVRRCMG